MKIAFTSCIRRKPFPIQQEWEYIYNEDPDYLFLLGDNIYMDYGIWPFTREYVGAPKKYTPKKFERIMRSKYESQFSVPAFQKLVAKMRRKNGFYATWDDHDFAWNNAKGALVKEEIKNISRNLFHQYLDCSTNLPHIYYHVDTPLARIIFIDNRFENDSRKNSKQIISKEQFNFIREKLDHPLPYTVLCGGITLIQRGENWKQYPRDLQQLCELLKNKERVFFLAGDVHYNTFVKPKRIKNTSLFTPPQLISSGMQINLLGLGISWDNRHNWGLLELEETSAQVTFYSRNKIQQRKSFKVNEWIQRNLF